MHARKTLLVIDDSPDIRSMFTHMFAACEIDVETAASYKDGLNLARQNNHDGIIVDVSLGGQDGDGVKLVGELRKEGDARPIMIVTARQDASLPAECYRAGADVFLYKPGGKELYQAAMLRLLTRGQSANPSSVRRVQGSILPRHEFRFAGAIINPEKLTLAVIDQDTPVHLNLKEVSLLYQLAQHVGRTVTRGDLSVLVWGAETPITSNTLDMHLSRLRKHYRLIGLELDSFILAQPKIGWQIKP